jgi:HAD superfamily hydrolase (TIGR01459 family)
MSGALPVPIAGLGAVIDGFEHVVLDQWGVLHKGEAVFPAALAAIAALRRRGISVAILSNSGRSAEANAHRLAELGLPRGDYDLLLTSGDLARVALEERRAPPFATLGRRCLLLTRGGDRSAVAGLPYTPVDDVAAADFILVCGLDEHGAPVEALDARLAAGVERRLPLICANPDLTMITPGALLPGPGDLARRYARRGGGVTYIGKPHPAIYEACLARLGHPSPERVLCVGDSLHHDVLGANRAGMASVLVTAGVHAPAFATSATAAEIAAVIVRLAGSEAMPRWTLPALTW